VSVDGVGRAGGQRSRHRAVGVAVLAGAVGAVSCVVFLDIVRAHGGGERGRVLAATHRAPATRAAAVADPGAAPSRSVAVRAVATKRAHALPVRRSPPNLVSRRPAHLPTDLRVRRHVGVVVLADYVPLRSPGGASAAPASTPASAATASVGAVPTNPPGGKRPEFGFER
jgi:hypothetical protein